MRKQLGRLRKRGFTLPEVLVTVTVVAVLAAVVVPAVTQYVGRGNGPATQNDVQQLRNAVTGFITDTRTYPANLADLVRTSVPAYVTNGSTWHGPYLSGSVGTGTTGATGQGLGSSGAGGAGNASFTSSGLSLAFADTIINTGSGTLELVVLSPTACGSLAAVDTAIDDKVSATGNFRVYGTCATPTSTADSARFFVATVGKS